MWPSAPRAPSSGMRRASACRTAGSSLAMSFYPVESAGDAGLGSLDRVSQARGRGVLAPLVALSVSGGGQRRRQGLRHGVSGPGLRRRRGCAARSCSGSRRTRSATPGSRWWSASMSGATPGWMRASTLSSTCTSPTPSSNGVYGPKRDQEYAPGGGNPVDEILPLLNDPQAPVILTNADMIPREIQSSRQLFQVGAGFDSAARADSRTGALRLGIPPLHPPMGLSTPLAFGFLSRDGKRGRARTCPGSGAAGTSTTGRSTSPWRT